MLKKKPLPKGDNILLGQPVYSATKPKDTVYLSELLMWYRQATELGNDMLLVSDYFDTSNIYH